MMIVIKTVSAAIAVVLTASPVVATAATNPLAKDQVVLDLRKLDLATVAGQRLLAIRMDQAAQDVCGNRLATIHLSLNAQSRACQAEVIADIRSQIDSRMSDAGAAAAPTQVALR